MDGQPSGTSSTPVWRRPRDRGSVSFVTGGGTALSSNKMLGEKELTKVTKGSLGTFECFVTFCQFKNRYLPVTGKGGTPQ